MGRDAIWDSDVLTPPLLAVSDRAGPFQHPSLHFVTVTLVTHITPAQVSSLRRPPREPSALCSDRVRISVGVVSRRVAIKAPKDFAQ